MLSEVKSFGSFRLDPANHCLWRDAERVSITPKAYDVLCYLVENSGRLVKPDEMLEAIWADTYVNPEVLRKYILEIRKALGDKTDDPQFICLFRESLAVVIETWVRDLWIGSEQCFTNILELLFGRQAGFKSSFDITLFTSRNNYLQMAADIANYSLDRIERGTAHEPVLDMPSG